MLYPKPTSKQKTRYGLYLCTCGREFKRIVNNKNHKCGCTIPIIKTPESKRLNRIYQNIKSRCYNKKFKRYSDYGERGIEVCQEWLHSFDNFYNWSLANGYEENLTIDRVNNNGNYEPKNCRWENLYIQNQNSRLLSSRNKSGYRGVSFNKKDKVYYSKITLFGKTVHLGSYREVLEAAKAYDTYAVENNLHHTINGVLRCDLIKPSNTNCI